LNNLLNLPTTHKTVSTDPRGSTGVWGCRGSLCCLKARTNNGMAGLHKAPGKKIWPANAVQALFVYVSF
jgi:hypothetical protein